MQQISGVKFVFVHVCFFFNQFCFAHLVCQICYKLCVMLYDLFVISVVVECQMHTYCVTVNSGYIKLSLISVTISLSVAVMFFAVKFNSNFCKYTQFYRGLMSLG